MREDYNVKIVETGKDIDKREKIKLVTSNGIPINTILKTQDVVISPSNFARLLVHNEHVKEGQNQDYEKLVIIDRDDAVYSTGSNAFISRFIEIWEMMHDDEESPEYSIKVSRQKSKNFDGDFLTCELI